MTVKRLSTSGSSVTPSTIYPDLLAGYGDFGALQRIAYQTGNGSSSQITFNNIPQTYQDLMVVVYGRDTGAGTGQNAGFIRFAPTTGVIDTGTTYSSTYFLGDGAGVASYRQTSLSYPYTGYVTLNGTTAGIHSAQIIHILNYRSSTYKTYISRSAADQNGSGWTSLHTGLWQNTSAITSVLVATSTSAFTTSTTVELFGVKASNA